MSRDKDLKCEGKVTAPIVVRAKWQRKFDCRERKSVNCEFAFCGGSAGRAGACAGAGIEHGAHNRGPVLSAVAVELR